MKKYLKLVPEACRSSVESLLNEYVKKYHEEIILSNIRYVNENLDNIENYGAYLRKAIENDYAKVNREMEKQIKILEQLEEQNKRLSPAERLEYVKKSAKIVLI